MTDTTPSPSNEPVDLDVIRSDDALLDALGRGEPGASDDGIDALLAAWRADLAVGRVDAAARRVDSSAGRVGTAEGGADLAAEAARVSTIRSAHPAAASAGVEPVPGSVRRQRVSRERRMPRRARIAVAAAAVAAAVGGTVGAAATATPGSPLWPISQAIYPARADRLAAEDALAQARRAVDARNFEQARRALVHAEQLISRVRDPREAALLRGELRQIEQLLLSATAPSGLLPTATAGPAPDRSSSAHPARPRTPGAHTSGPAPLVPNPPLPGLPPHTSPGLLPSSGLLPPLTPLPSLLPTLPLPGVGG
jgi:hypothetical protein